MEDKKNVAKPTYEELLEAYKKLQKNAGDLSVANQRMQEYIDRANKALSDEAFNQTSFFISMLFKVMEHPEMYNADFVSWAANHIEVALRTFEDAFGFNQEEEKDGNEQKAE